MSLQHYLCIDLSILLFKLRAVIKLGAGGGRIQLGH